MKQLTISIDFDGCISTFPSWPGISGIREDAKKYIKQLHHDGHIIIINTNRVGRFSDEARSCLDKNYIPYHHFNENRPEIINKYGVDSRKISADIYYDDKQAGGMIPWEDFYKYCSFLSRKTIICIIGESGSGKTMLAKYLDKKYNIPMIESYTTRPKRTPDEEGHTFVSDEEFDLFKSYEMIAYTKFGDYRYCCLHKDVDDICAYVIDEYGYNYLVENFSDRYNILSVRMYRDKKYIKKSIGKDRMDRDKGRFTMTIDEFDYIINGDNNKESVFRQADVIYDYIFVYKKNMYNEPIW